MKIILVDDEAGVRDQGKLFLEKFDPSFEVFSARSASEAIKRLSEENFDIIVSDYQMPKMNGLDLLREIREKSNEIPFIMFTGRGREEVAIEALNIGAQRYIKKGGDPKSQYGILGDAINQEVKHSKIKKSLKERERRYESFFKTTKDCAFITTKEGEWIEFNKAALDLFGYEHPGELRDVKIPDLYNDPERRKEVTTLIEKKGFAKDIPVDLVRKDGSVIHTHITSVVVKDENGKVIGYQGTIRDLTEIRQKEEELKKTKGDTKKILNSMNDAVMIHNPDGDFIFVNDAAVDHLGYSRDELLKMSPKDIASPKYYDNVEDRIKKIEEEKKLTFNFFHITKDGKEIPVEISSRLIEYRGNKVILSVVRDISQKQEKRFDIGNYKKICKPLFQNSLDGIYIHDLNGNFLDANKAALKMLGYDKEEITNLNVKDLLPEDRRQYVFENIKTIVESESSIQHKTHHLKRKDGEMIIVETDGCLLYEDGEPSGVIGIARDITKREEYESKLEKTTRKLKKLHDYAIKMNYAVKCEELYQLALEASKNVLDFEDSTLMKVNGDQIEIILTTAENVEVGSRYSISKTVAGKAFVEQKTIVVDDILMYEGNTSPSSDDYRSCIALPVGERGIFQVISDQVDFFSDFDKDMAELLALQLNTSLERLEREKETKKRKEEFQAFVESANVGVGINDENGKITFVNKTLSEMLGYKKDELVGRDLSDILDKEENTKMNRRIKYRMDGEKGNYECKIRKKDGDYIYVNVWASPLNDEEGRYIGDLGVLVDITDRKSIEKELTRNQKAIEGSIDGIAILDEEEKFVYLNDAHVTIYGYDDPGELIGESWKILYEGDELIRFEEYIMPKLRKNGFWRGEAVGIKNDGDEFDQEVTLTSIEDGGLICIVRDITKRKEFEKKLKEADVAFETSVTGIAITDVDRKLTRVNKTLLDMWGYDSEEEVLGKDAITFFKDQEENLESFNDFFDEGWMKEELIGVKNDGSEFYVEITANLIEDDEGKPKGIFASLTDITDRKNFEEREEFLHSLLRHDLKNKIQVSTGYIQLLEESDLLDEQSKGWIQKSKGSLLESLDLIDKVKELRRINKESEIIVVKIDDIIKESIGQQKPITELSEVKIDYDEKSVLVMGGELLEELFNNILENAILHSGCDFIKISMIEDEKHLTVVLEDDGIGIPDEKKYKIFEKGYKSERSKGSGLGMHLVKQIIDIYDGKIKVRDSDLGGTRFDVTLNKT